MPLLGDPGHYVLSGALKLLHEDEHDLLPRGEIVCEHGPATDASVHPGVYKVQVFGRRGGG